MGAYDPEPLADRISVVVLFIYIVSILSYAIYLRWRYCAQKYYISILLTFGAFILILGAMDLVAVPFGKYNKNIDFSSTVVTITSWVIYWSINLLRAKAMIQSPKWLVVICWTLASLSIIIGIELCVVDAIVELYGTIDHNYFILNIQIYHGVLFASDLFVNLVTTVAFYSIRRQLVRVGGDVLRGLYINMFFLIVLVIITVSSILIADAHDYVSFMLEACMIATSYFLFINFLSMIKKNMNSGNGASSAGAVGTFSRAQGNHSMKISIQHEIALSTSKNGFQRMSDLDLEAQMHNLPMTETKPLSPPPVYVINN